MPEVETVTVAYIDVDGIRYYKASDLAVWLRESEHEYLAENLERALHELTP